MKRIILAIMIIAMMAVNAGAHGIADPAPNPFWSKVPGHEVDGDLTVTGEDKGIWIKGSMSSAGGGAGDLPLLVDNGVNDGNTSTAVPSVYNINRLSHSNAAVFRTTRYGEDWYGTGSFVGISVVAQRSETTDAGSLFEYGVYSIFSHDGEHCTTNCGDIDGNAKMVALGGRVWIDELNNGIKEETAAVPETCFAAAEYFQPAINTSTLQTGDKFQVSANGCTDNPGVTGLVVGTDYYVCVFADTAMMSFLSWADAVGAQTGGGTGCDRTYGAGAVNLTASTPKTFYPHKYIVDAMAAPVMAELVLGNNLTNYVLQNANMFYAKNPTVTTGTIDAVSGLWIENMTTGTANYGIVLAEGDDGIYFDGTSGMKITGSESRVSVTDILKITPRTSNPASCEIGDLMMDGDGTVGLCLCTTAGTPGTWTDIGGGSDCT